PAAGAGEHEPDDLVAAERADRAGMAGDREGGGRRPLAAGTAARPSRDAGAGPLVLFNRGASHFPNLKLRSIGKGSRRGAELAKGRPQPGADTRLSGVYRI